MFSFIPRGTPAAWHSSVAGHRLWAQPPRRRFAYPKVFIQPRPFDVPPATAPRAGRYSQPT